MSEDQGGGASHTTDPAAGTSAATDVSLREYIAANMSNLHNQLLALDRKSEMRFETIKEQVDSAFAASQLAIDKADQATEKRFEGVNEFRAALADQAQRFVTAEQLSATVGRLEAGYQRNREDIDTLNDRMNIREGQSAGSRLTYGTLAALLAAFATVIGLLVVAANWLSGP